MRTACDKKCVGLPMKCTVAGSAASSLFDQYPDQCIGTAVMAVFGTPNIFFVHYAVKKWRGDHPDDVISRSDPDIRMTLYICLGILMVVFILLLRMRYQAHIQRATVGALRRRISRLGDA